MMDLSSYMTLWRCSVTLHPLHTDMTRIHEVVSQQSYTAKHALSDLIE